MHVYWIISRRLSDGGFLAGITGAIIARMVIDRKVSPPAEAAAHAR